MINIENVISNNVTALEVSDPSIGEAVWVITDRFFYVGRFRGRTKDGEFWILDRASMVIQMGVVTKVNERGDDLHEVHPFATPFITLRYSSIVSWYLYSHELPDRPITNG